MQYIYDEQYLPHDKALEVEFVWLVGNNNAELIQIRSYGDASDFQFHHILGVQALCKIMSMRSCNGTTLLSIAFVSKQLKSSMSIMVVPAPVSSVCWCS